MGTPHTTCISNPSMINVRHMSVDENTTKPKKTVAKKTVAKKPTAKKTEKTTAKKPTTKKTAEPTAKKPTAKKPTAKKTDETAIMKKATLMLLNDFKSLEELREMRAHFLGVNSRISNFLLHIIKKREASEDDSEDDSD